jgi:oligoendopeptidase F
MIPADTYWHQIATRLQEFDTESLSQEQVEAWIRRWDDVLKSLDERYTLLKRAKYLDVQNTSADREYNSFFDRMLATQQTARKMVSDKLLDLPHYLPRAQYTQLLRRLRSDRELYHPDNIPLQAEINALANTYRDLSWTIEKRADEIIATLAPSERSSAEHLEQLRAEQWLAERETLNHLLLALLPLRRQMAHNAGLPNYQAYRWRELYRLDYTPTDTARFHEAIAASLVPRLQRFKRVSASLPVRDAADLAKAAHAILGQVDHEFGAFFDMLYHQGFIDIGSRPEKAPVNEEWFFPETGLPFLLMEADLLTLLHEFGHGYHDYWSLTQQKLLVNMGAPDEFNECAAMAMMMLSYSHLTAGGYSAQEARLIMYDNLVRCLLDIPGFVLEDAFEHWVYSEAPETVQPQDLDAKWLELSEQYLPAEEWHGQEALRMTGWQRNKWSLFRMPFYMISYPLALLGAFQIWRNALANQTQTVQEYKAALACGNTEPLPKLFESAGVRFPLDPQAVEEITTFVATYLDEHPVE